jgi:hypothetical protein
MASAAATAAVQQTDDANRLWEVLMDREISFAAPFTASAWAMPIDAPQGGPAIEGHLTVAPEAEAGGFRVRRDTFGVAGDDRLELRQLPSLTLGFVQAGHWLLPSRRGSLMGAHPYWEWVVEPGHAWSEAGGGGWFRAVLPIALMERNANCVHHGWLALRFRAGDTHSRAAWQVSAETCAYLQFDAWGAATVTYRPAVLPSAADTRAAFHAEEDRRDLVLPITALEQDFPGVGAERFAAPVDVAPEDLTTFGVIVDGVHYSGGCPTRAGAHTFCERLPLPSYSLAKSLVAGLGLARLEARYPGSADEAIAAWVAECRQWRGVTLRHAVDMATGRYDSAAPDADEDAAVESPLFLAEDHATRLRYACARYPRRSAPGTVFAYHTSDTYVAVTAMNALLRQRAGPDQDIYRDLLVAELWKPLGLSPLTHQTRRTRDASGQPFGGWGLLLNRDDVGKLGRWLGQGAMPVAGQPPLDRRLIDAALRQGQPTPGLETGTPGLHYRGGFWALDVAPLLSCTSERWVPFMAGYGGIVLALFPNGVVYYRVSDGGSSRWREAIIAAHKIRPLCETR